MDQTSLNQHVRKYFDSIEWTYNFDEEDNFFSTGATISGGFSYTRMVVDVQDEILQCYAFAPVNVPEEKRQAACEYLMRASRGMKRGAFELDFSDGEVRFHTYIDVPEGVPAPNDELMEMLVMVPVAMMQRYGQGLLDIISGAKTPEEAVKMAEAPEAANTPRDEE